MLFTREFLINLRRKAFRGKIWYSVLDVSDRGFYNLTCVVVDRVRSPVLGREIFSLVLKLRDALKGKFVRLVESLGVKRAWEMSRLAVDWGYRCAESWKYNPSFRRFLTVNNYDYPAVLARVPQTECT